MSITDPRPVRALPGDWPTFTKSLDQAYRAGRERQLQDSAFVLAAVVRAIGGAISLTLPEVLQGKLVQTYNADGSITFEFEEKDGDQNERPQGNRPQLRQAWSADDPDGKGAQQGSQDAQGNDQDEEDQGA